jgi:putative lipoprotein
MLKKLILLGLVPVAGLVAVSNPAFAAEKVLSGEVLYRERIALPENAVVSVQLADVSRMDAAADVIGEQEISPAGQVPVKFEIRFNDSKITKNMTYALQARITVDGELWFINDTHHGVDPLASEAQTILVKRVAQDSTDALRGVEWTLVSIEGFGELPDNPVTFSIDNEERAGGRGPCNGYFGSAKIDGEAVSLSQIGATQMACEPARMKAERAYFDALGEVKAYAIDDGQLVLTDSGGKEVLRFKKGA